MAEQITYLYAEKSAACGVIISSMRLFSDVQKLKEHWEKTGRHACRSIYQFVENGGAVYLSPKKIEELFK